MVYAYFQLDTKDMLSRVRENKNQPDTPETVNVNNKTSGRAVFSLWALENQLCFRNVEAWF